MNEIPFQLFIFFIAGYETTATAVTVVLKLLAENPKYVEKIRKEAGNEISDMNSHGFKIFEISRPIESHFKDNYGLRV